MRVRPGSAEATLTCWQMVASQNSAPSLIQRRMLVSSVDPGAKFWPPGWNAAPLAVKQPGALIGQRCSKLALGLLERTTPGVDVISTYEELGGSTRLRTLKLE